MPYIPDSRRKEIGDFTFTTTKPGELNYAITCLCLNYLGDIDPVDDNTYSDYNEVIGVLECVKQELYRRLIVPYEDEKCEENGDVF